MRFFSVLGILFYAAVIVLAGVVLIVLSLNLLQPQDIMDLLIYMQNTVNSRIIVGLSRVLLILISFPLPS